MRQAIEALKCLNSIDWLVDANVILNGKAAGFIDEPCNVHTTSEVAVEVLARPRAVSANDIIASLERANRIITRSNFERIGFSVQYDFIEVCSRALSPNLRCALHDIETNSDSKEQLNRACQLTSNDGTFFRLPDAYMTLIDAGLFTMDDLALPKGIRRSWFQYPAKRRKRENDGTYKCTDEKLVAIGVANAILSNRSTIIVSDDSDIATIMKQCADNVLWASSNYDCRKWYKRPTFQRVSHHFKLRARELERYRRLDSARRLYNPVCSSNGEMVLPLESDVGLYRPTSSEFQQFAFSPPFRGFICQNEWIKGCNYGNALENQLALQRMLRIAIEKD